MKAFGKKQVWFITGSQDLYGPRVLEEVANNSQKMVEGFNGSADISMDVVYKPTVKSPKEIHAICQAANSDETVLV